MIIKENTDMLLFRFSNFGNNAFVSAHQEVLKNAGYVWMLKVGKRSSVAKLKEIKYYGGWLVLRSPKSDGSKSFIARFTEMSEEEPGDTNFPSYYTEVLNGTDEDDYSISNTTYQWFKLEMIEELKESDAESLVVSKTGKKLNEVIGTTRTAVMFIRNSKPIIVYGGDLRALF